MSALLRSGKILRLVSGFATRQQQQQQFPNPGGPGGGGGGGGNPAADSAGLSNDKFDASATFSAWSLQHLQCALPAVSADGGGAERALEDDDDKLSLEDIGHNITKDEIRSLLRGVGHLQTASPAKHSQSVLVLRLCGAALENDVPDAKERTDMVNELWTEMEESLGVRMTVDHYNALLAVYADNKHDFSPEHVNSRLRKSGLKPNKETLRALLDRYCQEGNMDGANNMLKALFQEHRQPSPPREIEDSSAMEATKQPQPQAQQPTTARPFPDSSSCSASSTPPVQEMMGSAMTQTEVPMVPMEVGAGVAGTGGQIVVVPPAQQNEAPTVMRAVPMVQVFNPQSHTYEYQPMPTVCQAFRDTGRFWDLENLLNTSMGSYTPEDRRTIFLYTLLAYSDRGMYDRALSLWQQLQAEGLAAGFDHFHAVMGQMAVAVADTTPVVASEMPTPPPSDVGADSVVSAVSAFREAAASNKARRRARRPSTPASASTATTDKEASAKQIQLHKLFKRALNDKDCNAALNAYNAIDGNNKGLNVTECSALIELLVNADRLGAAMEVAESMLERSIYPLPKIFRFLLNKMASSGEVDAMTRMGDRLLPKVKKEVSFDNRLCNAYLSADRGRELIGLLSAEVDAVLNDGVEDEETVQGLKDRFPRGGAMGLLEENPQLVDEYAELATKYVQIGYIAPVNVLWTYHFINANHDKAQPLWDAYVKDCPQIMFQKVCQTARTRKDADMAGRLVDLLKGARVTGGARGIALSCLLDVLCYNGQYREAAARLTDAVEESGVRLEDVNRTALLRLKAGLEPTGAAFPYEIPRKRVGSSSGSIPSTPAFTDDEDDASRQQSRCLSPVNEMA